MPPHSSSDDALARFLRTVGTAALQLGSLAGLKMFGTASKAKHELVASLGGIPIDYRTEDFVLRAAGVMRRAPSPRETRKARP